MSTNEQRKGRCKNKATAVYPWAGKLMEACDAHARAMVMIGHVIGATTEVKSIVTDNMCMHMDDLTEDPQKNHEEKNSGAQ